MREEGVCLGEEKIGVDRGVFSSAHHLRRKSFLLNFGRKIERKVGIGERVGLMRNYISALLLFNVFFFFYFLFLFLFFFFFFFWLAFCFHVLLLAFFLGIVSCFAFLFFISNGNLLLLLLLLVFLLLDVLFVELVCKL